MSVPTTREELKDYCLRSLGHTVIDINVSEEQLQDRIDEALSLYHEHHFDSIEPVYLSHQLTAGDVANTYIEMPDAVRGVTRIFPVGTIDNGILSGANPFSLAYQLRVSDMYTFFSNSMLDYYLYKRHLTLIEEILSGNTPIRFTKHQRRLHVDGNWTSVLQAGAYLIIECQRVLDPDMYPAIWSDDWLQRYTTALFKRQWGNNIGKYRELRLIGGAVLRGGEMLAEAKEEIEELRLELRDVWSLPPEMKIG